MDLGEALRRRRMVRRHIGQPISDDSLDRIIAAGLAAPTAGNSQGVALIAINDTDGIADIAEIANEGAYVARGFEPWISTAGAIIVLCAESGAYHDRYRAPDKDPSVLSKVPWWWVDAGAALMAVLLAVVDEGLAAGFLGAQSLDGLDEHLGIPADVDVVGIITIGPPAPDRRAASLDRPQRRRLHRHRWGG